MAKPKNAMELFQFLDKSNCRRCDEKTCLAFAGAVLLGRRNLSECPKLPPAVLSRFAIAEQETNQDLEGEAYLAQLKSQIKDLDLAAAADRTGGRFTGRQLTIKVLGKDFSVDADGNFSSDLHVNQWVAVPFLDYVLHGQGLPVSGQWITFRELNGGLSRYPFFSMRCEDAMKQVADGYTELFDDLVHLFSGRQVERQFQSDISVVLHPLPKIPMMICYWRADEGMASSLHVFFDQSADRNLGIGSLFNLGTGLAQMFTKIALRHGWTANGRTPSA